MAFTAASTSKNLTRLKRQGRVTGLVSRGGFHVRMGLLKTKKENPLYSNFDYVLEIAKEHDVVLFHLQMEGEQDQLPIQQTGLKSKN